MSEHSLSDQQARSQALDPATSFIVQAPAGSGKTELITQRFLRLLTTVDNPEEILAITFTRKAAAEMRNRILQALDDAQQDRPDSAHKGLTWDLAQAVKQRSRDLHWGLEQTPGRLRVQTIDGLCAWLTRQMPLVSELGAAPSVSENAQRLYQSAARRTLAALDDDLNEPLSTLLRHLDNNAAQVTELIAGLMPSREQWLRHLMSDNTREGLEQGLRRAVQQHLQVLSELTPRELTPKMLGLARFAAANLGDTAAGLTGFADPERTTAELELPGADTDELVAWLGLAGLLLTKDKPELRKTVTVKNGFPAPSSSKDPETKQRLKTAKEDFKQLTQDLQAYPAFVNALNETRFLPPHRISAQAWALLEAMRDVLIRGAVELSLTFQDENEVDFTEVHLRAQRALGSPEHPTDLALALDYRIRHILVDEFQDTSHGQFELLKSLTAGWQNNDGRSLFVVGDPMQSIYGFREAEVGLYLRARSAGIGEIKLQPLELTANFRSQAGIVDWVNTTFPEVLPQAANAAAGAVPYSPSQAVLEPLAGPAVNLYGFAENDVDAEAQKVCDLVRRAQQEHPGGTTAILARGRAHLSGIARKLKDAQIPFQAVELVPLSMRAVVQDLRSLTRALLFPGDRLAWLSILRAPWCGLTLNDLLLVCGDDDSVAIWDRLNDPGLAQVLSDQGKLSVARLSSTLELALAQRRRAPLRQWLQQTWRDLGGDAVLAAGEDRAAVEAYFELLQNHTTAQALTDLALFDEALQRLYAPADTAAGDAVQLMTMHKAKGLEFDTVILPGLGKSPGKDASALLEWMEVPHRDSDQLDLLLAPIKSALDDDEPIYSYLRRLRKAKSGRENGRLLYVAATRAKRRLHLLGHAKIDAKTGEPKPLRNSLLGDLWPALRSEFTLDTPAVDPRSAEPAQATNRLFRLAADWQATPIKPVLTPLVPNRDDHNQDAVEIAFDWAGQTARHIGTLVHRWLERIARDGLEQWPSERIASLRPALYAGLANLGVLQDDLEPAARRCQQALERTLQDERGRWVLHHHPEHVVEYALSSAQNGEIHHYVIDRTFVDDTGTRWIIDYKTGYHEGSDVDSFLDQEVARYRQQLEGYAELMRRREDRPIRLGLYFPLLSSWREWQT